MKTLPQLILAALFTLLMNTAFATYSFDVLK